MRLLTILLCIVALAAADYDNSDLYDGFKILRVTPKTLRAKERIVSILRDFRVLKAIAGEDVSYDVVISPDQLDAFKDQMNQLSIEVTVLVEDLEEAIEDHMEENKRAKKKARRNKKSSRMDHTYYRNLDETNAELATLVADNPTLMSEVSLGQTLEGRDMNLVKVSTDGTDTKPIIWIDCGIHAREWVTPASCLFFLDSLSQYGQDSDVTSLLDKYDFHVLTIVNPDGYDFTWTDDRLWRKNRFPSGTCYGVDLNRNWDAHWNEGGASENPCLDTYDGTSAFSELETQHLRDNVLNMNGRILMYFSLHSYSQLWMYPYGYTREIPADNDEMDRVAAIGVQALTAVYGTSYDYGTIARTIYVASGNTLDWTYDAAGIVYSYTLELRDTGAYGFELPPDQITPTATETWEGLKAAINAVP